MKFYSYDYVTSQISVFNWVHASLAGLLALALAVTLFQYYHHRKDSKYRELALILLLSGLLLGLTTISQYQTNQVSDNRYRTSKHFIELVSDGMKVDKSKIYVNTAVATDGAILKINDDYYRALQGDDSETYLLEKIELKNPKIELVEVEN